MSLTRSASDWICPVKQSFVSKRDGRPGLDLEHRLEVRPEAPDHLVARDDVIDGHGRHHVTVAGGASLKIRPTKKPGTGPSPCVT